MIAPLLPYEKPWNGHHWWHMPGDDADHQKLNFALWRRGLKEYEFDEEKGTLREICPIFGLAGGHSRYTTDTTTAAQQRHQAAQQRQQAAQRHRALLISLSQRCRTLRSRGLTYQAIAQACGVSASHIAKLTSGEGMSVQRAVQLERALADFEARPTLPVTDRRRFNDAPPGTVPFKHWLSVAAQQRGLLPGALRMLIHRGQFTPPPIIRLNARRHFVPLSYLPAA